MAKKPIAKNSLEKEFINTFEELCYSRSNWQVWADFITVSAIALANRVEDNEKIREKREAEYERCIERLGGVEKPAKMFAILTEAMTENPEQDFLGNMFMNLNLGNHWVGQFFTPYHLCEFMAEINIDGLEETISHQGWVSVFDCACGAGATLIAAANIMRKHEVNYQNHALFVAQDVDRTAAMMCYVQLSLLGCAGYVVVGNTLTNPIIGDSALFPVEKDSQEFWYTPMFASDIWKYRRLYNSILLEMREIFNEKEE